MAQRVRWGAAIGLLLVGCTKQVAGGGGPPMCSGTQTIAIPQSTKNNVDLLFMIDNSPGMEGKAARLRDQLPKIFDYILKPGFGQAIDLHIGVITSDYGAGATGAPGCTPSPGGQLGKLQGLGANAPPACLAPMGANFLRYRVRPDGFSLINNLPPGQSLLDTLHCMMAVGTGGCGFEHSLESTYAALHDQIPGNAGFVRDDALLVVVFLTDEDDGSAPPDTDIFDKDRSALYGYEDSYSRRTRLSVMCGKPPQFPPYGDSGGPLADCGPAPNHSQGKGPGKAYDVSRYVELFTHDRATGGVKANPLDVVLIAIDGPENPFQVILSDPGTASDQPYAPCARLDETGNPPCVPVLQHSCWNKAKTWAADPAVRLNTVVRAVRNSGIVSICDDDYASVFARAFPFVNYDWGGGCFPGRLDPDAAHPDCAIEDVTFNAGGTTTAVQIPACATTPGAIPCWRMEKKDACSFLTPDGMGITIDRGGDSAPDNTTVLVTCAIFC